MNVRVPSPGWLRPLGASCALLAWLSACAGRPGTLPASAGPASGAWTARIIVGEEGGGPDAWIDIQVPGSSEREQRTCASLHDEEFSLLRQQPVAFRTAQACSRSALPAMPKRSPPVWLLESGRVLADGEAPPHELTPGAAVRWFSRFETQARCEESLAALQVARVQAHAESGTRAGEFLEEELRKVAARRDESCAMLTRLPKECRRSRDPGRCTVERAEAERSCERDQQLHQVVLERVDRVARERQSGPPLSPGELTPRCRPE